jgi:hypothetical protein
VEVFSIFPQVIIKTNNNRIITIKILFIIPSRALTGNTGKKDSLIKVFAGGD